MKWDWNNRSITLSVGELARFSLASSSEDGSGRWRAELGTRWHQVLRERAEADGDGWEFENAVAGTLWQDGWQFCVKGRMDQFLPGKDGAVIREIKTVSCQLPAEESSLRLNYTGYFHQAMLYAFLKGQQGAFPTAELVFLEIQTGLSQTVVLGDDDLKALHLHLGNVVSILEERRTHFGKLRQLQVPPPFENWREGQEESRQDLLTSHDKSDHILFEAPTGYGKTGLVLEQALGKLAEGEVERILLLTGKNTGHSPLLDQLQEYMEKLPNLTVHALRSRQDHALNHDVEIRMSSMEIMERWQESGLSAPELLKDGLLELETIRKMGEKYSIPPFAITRMLLPYADVWIADFNYLFDPGVARFFETIPTFDPAKTYLVIDEAHNLPERAAACHSHVLVAQELERLLTEVQFARFPGSLSRPIDLLYSIVKKARTAESMDPPVEADLISTLREVHAELLENGLGEDELSEESRELLWNIPQIIFDWDQTGLPMHLWCSAKGRVHISCLDAASAIEPVLSSFRRVLLMSATLQPWPNYQQSIGSNNSHKFDQVVGKAPWMDGCFEILVDARVDTRYRQRDGYADTTAKTVAQTALEGNGCTAVFFPSYRYAETIFERIRFQFPQLRCEVQPRNLTLEEQQSFLETALLLDDVLFLVMGSRFSEGIDALGDKVSQAIVVSPSLPEVNALQKAREGLIPGNKASGFRSIYLIPGMRKINQALGRLVRSPDQRARVLLHGKRFLEPAYMDLLPGYLQPQDHILTDEDFVKKWLEK